MRKRILLTIVLVVAASLNTACFLRLTLGVQEAQTLSQEIELIVHAIRAEATTAVCQTDPFFSPNFQRCTYFINGVEVASTVHLLQELGPFGAMIDPVILELPADVTNIAGTYNGGPGKTGNLIVYPKLSFVPVDESRRLAAGPGKQLAIIDLPAGVPVQGETYTFNLSFRKTAPRGSGPTPFKALMTGKVQAYGKSWYPPLLPCTTNLGSLPTLTLPQGLISSLQPIQLPAAAGCTNANYLYFIPRAQCDLDNDADVDRADVNLIMAVRDTAAAPGDPRDFNGDRIINANDARFCTTRCTRPLCSN